MWTLNMNSVTTSKRRWLCVSVCGAVVCGFRRPSNFLFPAVQRYLFSFLAYETNSGCPSVRRAALCDIVKRCASQGLRVGIVLLNPLTQRALKNVRAYKLFKIIIQERRGFNEVRDTLGSSDIPRGYTVLRWRAFCEPLRQKPTLAAFHTNGFNPRKSR